MRSSRRPGQATTMSTPALERGDLAVLADAAEDRGGREAVGRGERLERPRRSAWRARGSGRARGRAGGRGGACRRRARRRGARPWGCANARVLPEPVLPRPSTSRPASVSGRVSTWIGNAVVLPSAARAATRGAGTPSVLKVMSVTVVAFRGMRHRRVSGARGAADLGSPTVGIWRRRRSAHPFAV